MDREFLSRFPDGTLIRWKPLTWAQYRALVRDFGNPASNDAVLWSLCEQAAVYCVIDQEQDGHSAEFEDLYAGTIYVIGKLAINQTGFVPDAEKIQHNLSVARAAVNSDWYTAAKASICAVFHIREEELEEWTLDKFMRHAAMVEFITKQPMNVVSDEAGEDGVRRQFMMGPDGQKIPLLTKADIQRRRAMKHSLPDEIENEVAGRFKGPSRS